MESSVLLNHSTRQILIDLLTIRWRKLRVLDVLLRVLKYSGWLVLLQPDTLHATSMCTQQPCQLRDVIAGPGGTTTLTSSYSY